MNIEYLDSDLDRSISRRDLVGPFASRRLERLLGMMGHCSRGVVVVGICREWKPGDNRCSVPRPLQYRWLGWQLAEVIDIEGT